MDRRTQSQTVGMITLMVLVTVLVAFFCLRSPQSAPTGSITVKNPAVVPPPPHTSEDDPPEPPPSASAAHVSTPPSAPLPAEIVVHVAGAVLKPGVYRLQAGARNQDALNAAGGPTALANTDAVNLAALVQDGSQIYFPTREEQANGGASLSASSHRTGRERSRSEENTSPAATSNAAIANNVPPAANGSNQQPAQPDKLTDPSQGQVNINTASSEELQRLPGIGPALADRILAYRQANGGFKTVEELREVSGIGEKKFAKIQPFIRVN